MKKIIKQEFFYSSIREEGSCDGTPTPEGLPDRYS